MKRTYPSTVRPSFSVRASVSVTVSYQYFRAHFQSTFVVHGSRALFLRPRRFEFFARVREKKQSLLTRETTLSSQNASRETRRTVSVRRMVSSEFPEAPDMVVVTSAYGSEGDVGPLLALARETRRLAPSETRVVFVSNPRFAPPEARPKKDDSACLEFVGVGTSEAYDFMLANSSSRADKRALPKFWLAHLGEHFQALASLADQARRVVVVAHPLDLAARCFEEHWELTNTAFEENEKDKRFSGRRVLCVTAVLSPAMLRCDDVRPPVFGGSLGGVLRFYPSLSWRIRDAMVDFAFGGSGLDAFRRELFKARVLKNDNASRDGPVFEPTRGVYRDWFLCRGGVFALWPSWFGPPHPRWPKKCVQLGFPGEVSRESDLDASSRAFLENARRSEEDVWVFMVSSGNPPHARAFFQAAVRVASRANVHAILLTRHAEVVPSPETVSEVQKKHKNASRVLHLEHCDLRAFLSHESCVGVVHSGGVGTTAVALTCGVAQIVVPHGWDQHDNARRAKRFAGDSKADEISISRFVKKGEASFVARTMKKIANGSRISGDVSEKRNEERMAEARSWGGARRAAEHVLFAYGDD